jgi:hypothetical protein
MSLADGLDDISLAGSRQGSLVFPGSDGQLLDLPPISPLGAHLAQHLVDTPVEFLSQLEERLSRYGIVTLAQLASLKAGVDGTQPTASSHRLRVLYKELWDKVLRIFKPNQALQRIQFTQAADAAAGPAAAVTSNRELARAAPHASMADATEMATLTPDPDPRTMPPTAAQPIASCAASAPPPPPPPPVMLTREALASRIQDAFGHTEKWTVPEHVWDSFLAVRGANPVLQDAVTLDPSDAKARLGCPIRDRAGVRCATTLTVHFRAKCWVLSALLDHIKLKHPGPGVDLRGEKRPAEGQVAQLDAYWRSVRQRTSATAATVPAGILVVGPAQANITPGAEAVASLPVAPAPAPRSIISPAPADPQWRS